MRERLHEWLEDTHGTGFELVRHFLARFFDNDMAAGEWQKVAYGLLACFLSAGILGIRTYFRRYYNLQLPEASTPAIYRHAVREDLILFVAIAMAITALLTILRWESLFPSLRDSLALAGMPVSARDIFLAKFGALILVFVVFVLALTAIPAGLFAAVIAGPWQENPSGPANAWGTFAALGGVCVFMFFGLLGVQGILLNVLPGRLFTRVSLFVQATVFIATVGGLPLLGRQPTSAAWWPPVWFVRLWEAMVTGVPGAGRTAVLAMTLPVALSVLAYLASYHRYRRLLLEAKAERGGAGRSRAGGWLLDRWMQEPRQQAAFTFLWKTLMRSRNHRLILLAYAGVALGWIVKGALDAPAPSLRDQGMYGLVVVLAPLALAILVMLALRYLFSLPVALPANWVFQAIDRDGRAAWLAAVERFVVWCGVAPVFVASLPASIAVLGWLRAAAATALAVTASLVCFEWLFRNWRKLPFTCSYLPGKQPVWLILVRCALGVALLGPIAQLFLYASAEPTAFLALFTMLGALCWRWRSARRREWAECDLLYEEAPEAVVMELGLQQGEEGQMETHAIERPEAAMFSATLVASRGLLPQAWAEEIAEERRDPLVLWKTFREDVRYGARLIRRNPLLSAVVVLTLTVGIGINASVFTVADGLALRPHVYKDPASFVRVVAESRAEARVRFFSYGEFLALHDGTRSLRQLAAFRHLPVMIGDDDPVGTLGMLVSCNFFLVDGLDRPILGRLLDAGDCRAPGQAPVAVISQSIWRSRFMADTHVVGRVVRVLNRPVTIVGVVPDRTAGWTMPAGIWMPFTVQPYFEPDRNFFRSDFLWLSLAGRLAPGYSRSQAEAELETVARQLNQNEGRDTSITTTDGSWIREFELTASGRDLMLLAFLAGAFNLVLLISCANVATLLLSRAATRRREIAVRLSLGAPRVRLVRMLVTESLLLAACAGVASAWLVRHVPAPLFHYLSRRVPDFPMNPDWSTFAYISAVVLATGVLAGLAPALESLKVDLAASLKGHGGNILVGAAVGARVRGFLVSAQVAMSMVLLVGAALFAQSENHTLHRDPGYLPQKIVVAPLRFPDNTTQQTAAARLDAIAARMRRLPGVHEVAFTDDVPMFGDYTVQMRPPLRPDALEPVDVYTASPGFFETMGIPILRGRGFEAADRLAAVVSQRMARAFWPRQDAVGKLLTLPLGAVKVVGVARDVSSLRFGGSDNMPLYVMRQPNPVHNFLAVRFDTGEARGAQVVRAALRETDPNLIVIARVMQSWIDMVTEELWNLVSLILILGVVATILATSGIYGAVSFSVNQRTHDLGIRLALGAQRIDVAREVLISGGKPVVKGLLVGLWLSVATAAALHRNLKGTPLPVDSSDPMLYCGAALLLSVAAVLAMAGPARRGANCDPLDALRCE